MRKRRQWKNKALIGCLLTLAAGSMGYTYAKWIVPQSVSAGVTTDSFDMKYLEDGTRYHISITDGNVEEDVNQDIQLNLKDKGQVAVLTFRSGIPRELLTPGKYIKISCPIVQSDGKEGTLLPEKEVDFTEEGKKVVLTPAKIFVSYEGAVYEVGDTEETTAYNQLLEFWQYDSVEEKDDTLYSCIYLGALPETLEKIDAFPKSVEIEESLLETPPEEDMETSGNGIIVTYRGELELHLDQLQSKGM